MTKSRFECKSSLPKFKVFPLYQAASILIERLLSVSLKAWDILIPFAVNDNLKQYKLKRLLEDAAIYLERTVTPYDIRKTEHRY